MGEEKERKRKEKLNFFFNEKNSEGKLLFII